MKGADSRSRVSASRRFRRRAGRRVSDLMNYPIRTRVCAHVHQGRIVLCTVYQRPSHLLSAVRWHACHKSVTISNVPESAILRAAEIEGPVPHFWGFRENGDRGRSSLPRACQAKESAPFWECVLNALDRASANIPAKRVKEKRRGDGKIVRDKVSYSARLQ